MRRAKGVSFGRPRHTAPISLWQESAILDRPTRSSFVHLTAMAMGKRPAARQASPMWVDTADLRTSDGHPFFERLNRVLEEAGFDAFVEGLCAAFYAARMGHPSLRPGRYFRLLFIGYFEGLSSERGIAWRVTDSLSLRAFLDLDVTEAAPVVRRQLLWPLALPHLGMLPTVLRKIVLRFQPGTGQFLVTRPARARWRDSIGGNVSAHHRVSCPVHAGARHAGDLVDHHGLYGTGCRRRRRAPDTGHRSLNPNVTPPGLRPGAREGEPQARRCRSRVSVPSSAVERGPGRSARPVGRRHAQASRAGQRPGRTEPPRGRPDNRGAAAWQWAGSAPSPRRRAPRWRSRRPPRAVRNRMSPSPSGTGHRSLNPNVTPPGLRPGAREGEPQARRCRSRVSVPSSAVERGPGRSARPVGRRHAQASRAGQRPGRTEPPRGRPDNRGTAVWQWAGSAPAPAA